MCPYVYGSVHMYMHTYVKKETYNLLEALWISVGAPSQICSLWVQERALWRDGILSRWRSQSMIGTDVPRKGGYKKSHGFLYVAM